MMTITQQEANINNTGPLMTNNNSETTMTTNKDNNYHYNDYDESEIQPQKSDKDNGWWW